MAKNKYLHNNLAVITSQHFSKTEQVVFVFSFPVIVTPARAQCGPTELRRILDNLSLRRLPRRSQRRLRQTRRLSVAVFARHPLVC